MTITLTDLNIIRRSNNAEDVMRDKHIKLETAEEAVARGVKVLKFEEGKIHKSKIKKTTKVDVKLLLEHCNEEQKIKLNKILEEQGLKLD